MEFSFRVVRVAVQRLALGRQQVYTVQQLYSLAGTVECRVFHAATSDKWRSLHVQITVLPLGCASPCLHSKSIYTEQTSPPSQFYHRFRDLRWGVATVLLRLIASAWC
jgi:hypothetical protein